MECSVIKWYFIVIDISISYRYLNILDNVCQLFQIYSIYHLNTSKTEEGNGNVNIKIYNQDGNVYYEEFKNMTPFKKMFNVNELEPGNYIIKVSDENISRTVEFKR